ncbi:MAG: anhydro-N-acetylmuramic acid kinase, partial [Bacteroidia bacterium]
MIVLGIMSGTSLDGLDLVFAQFDLTPETKQQYQWKIIKGKTIDYNLAFKDKLSKAVNLSGFELMQLHADFGVYLGKCCKDFIDESKVIPDLIASHGHTVFHEVKKGFTTQIGDGHKIAAITGVNTIFDFRSLNVAYGGQGAPLVPIGDEFLFSEYDSCLNLGGIANISYKLKNKRLAFDICPFNLLLNKFALQNGYAYDAGGKMAKSGKVCSSLLLKLREIPYYKQTGAKSLDKEQLLHYYNQLFNGFNLSVVDFLSTL